MYMSLWTREWCADRDEEIDLMLEYSSPEYSDLEGEEEEEEEDEEDKWE